MYKGLKQPDLFSGLINARSNGKPIIPDTVYNKYLDKLIYIMEVEKPYLESSLTLNELAEKMSISPRYVSYIINKSFNKNFFDFINGYRIEESRRLLKNPENRSRTVLEILYESGFNSKSVFNSAFRKYTGTTPTQFKREAFS